MTSLIIHLGRWALRISDDAGKVIGLVSDFAYWTIIAPLRGKGLRIKETVYQIVQIGYLAVPLIMLISFFNLIG